MGDPPNSTAPHGGLAPRPPRAARSPRRYAFVCFDGPDAAQRRSAAIADHVRFMEAVWREVLVAGPLQDPADGTVVGSLYVIAAADEVSARRLLESDPFFVAGIWRETQLLGYTPALGTWIGGRIWD